MFAGLPKLRSLEVGTDERTDALCEAIADRAPQLERLVLVGTFTTAGIAALEKLRHLRELVLRGELPDGAYARLQHLAPTVHVTPIA